MHLFVKAAHLLPPFQSALMALRGCSPLGWTKQRRERAEDCTCSPERLMDIWILHGFLGHSVYSGYVDLHQPVSSSIQEPSGDT